MLKRCLFFFGLLVFALFAFKACSTGGDTEFDILLTNGNISDGTGSPLVPGDVGIKGDTIVAVGDLAGKTAVKIIDATGLVVSPGFIDMHTHCDSGLGELDSNANLNYLIQGTTTVVTGNCGGSVSLKVAETKAKWEEQGIGTNAVFMVGFGTIREAVIKHPSPKRR